MKKFTLSSVAVLLGALVAAPQAMAAAGIVHFTGELVESACNVSTDSRDQTVDMGRWPTSQFSKTGSVSAFKAFKINLSNCDEGSYTIRFDGSSPAGRPDLLALKSGGAEGVGIELLDLSNSVFPIAQEISDPALVQVDENGNASVDVKARYKSYQDEVSAGRADADATFAIEYR
ncbi:fimbrial protein [Carnimonas bestiolae]|uniref:fimbrial protein n=1 Tax=Carnimonas bestiolae TaxID=3402172 RepID=UPI003EDC0182